jgi:hypothetical protein
MRPFTIDDFVHFIHGIISDSAGAGDRRSVDRKQRRQAAAIHTLASCFLFGLRRLGCALFRSSGSSNRYSVEITSGGKPLHSLVDPSTEA